MKHLLTIKERDFIPKSLPVDVSKFGTRDTARAIVLSDDNEVYLMNVSAHNYHKLPGGGVDECESITQALERELLEEIGCKAEVLAEIGIVTEERNFENLLQTSYGYLVRQVGEQTEAALEAAELAEGMLGVKVKNIKEAIKQLNNDTPDNLAGKFILKRELAFLEAANKHLKAPNH